MGIPGSANPMLFGGAAAYQINQSLRFDGSAYLNRTPASAGNRKTWTWSGWLKRSRLFTADEVFFNSNGGTDSTRFDFYWISNDTFEIDNYNTRIVRTTQVFRDPSAWYHLVVALDTTQATASNRLRVYINGQEITSFSIDNRSTAISQNADMGINGTTQHNVGGYTSYYYNGYAAEVNLIDGTALTPSSFGETDTITGAWIPKKYSGSYGTNGFYLKFESSGIGTDSSGNGNTWTANNFSTSGTGTDVMSDTPTNNWCTLNPLDTHAVAALTDGNLAITGQSASKNGLGTIAVNNGKWYYEAQYTTAPSTNSGIGVATIGTWSNMSDMDSTPSGIRYRDNGVIYQNGASQGTFASYTTNDIIGVAFDCDNGQISFYKNNTLQTTLTGVTALQNNSITACLYNYAGNMAVNFGQRSFSYTPPSNFKALCTANLPEPTIKKGGEYFNTVLWTGNGTSGRQITGIGFQPDFVWSKARNQAYSHRLHDAVRGREQSLLSNSTGAEFTQANSITSFDTDGFTVGSDGSHNGSGVTYVGWNWKANGAGSSNTAGTITSTVSANATAGFSIVTYTGNSTAGATIGHGLGVAPSMVIVKSRTYAATSWCVSHSGYPTTQTLYLDDTTGVLTRDRITARTASTFTVGSHFEVNDTGDTYVAYCFSEVAGYSKFGSYTGNGSTDGVFVHCGFRPRWIMVKTSSNAYGWAIFDTARQTYNEDETLLQPNTSSAEATNSAWGVDILSNGFKWRNGGEVFNFSGYTYIFAAFAELPAKYSNAR